VNLKIIGDPLTKKDAVLLAKWWNENMPKYQFEVRKSETNPRYWCVVRIEVKP